MSDYRRVIRVRVRQHQPIQRIWPRESDKLSQLGSVTKQEALAIFVSAPLGRIKGQVTYDHFRCRSRSLASRTPLRVSVAYNGLAVLDMSRLFANRWDFAY